jgi:hypothetical protein
VTQPRVIGELLATGALRRAIRWQPPVAAWTLVGLLLLWRADDTQSTVSAVWLLRVIAGLLALGVVSVLDDAAAETLAPVPFSLAWRCGLRVAVAILCVAPAWVGAILWVRPAVPVAALTLECATLVAVGLAVAGGVARWFDANEPGVAAGPTLAAIAYGGSLLPQRWALYDLPGESWSAVHLRWAVMLGAAVAVLAVTLRDPGRPNFHFSRGHG